MEIVFFFLLSNLKSTLSSLRQCLGLPPKCLLEVRLYWKQFTHYLVHIAILKVTTAKDVPLIMAQLWLWEFFLLSPWTEALTCFQDTVLWMGLALLQYLRYEDWSNLRQVGPVVTVTYLFLRCSHRQQEYGTHYAHACFRIKANVYW